MHFQCGTLKILAHNCNHQQGLVKQKMSLSIIVLLRLNFLNTFIKIAILGQIYQCINCYAKLQQHSIECICVHSSPIIHFFDHKKSGLPISVHFHKNSLIVTCCTFGRFEIWTLTPNRFKNQTNDTFRLLGHSYNHQQGFLIQKIVTLHHCGFNLKFPKHLFWVLFWVNINEIAVTKN